MKRFLYAAGCILMVLLAISCTGNSQSSMNLELLGEVVIPHNYELQGTPVGGLSGLAYDADKELYYVLSDDRSEFAAARYYSFRLKLNENLQLTEESIIWEDVIFLHDSTGSRYGKGQLDPEGIAAGEDSLIYVSSEGDPTIDVPPFVNAFSPSGRFVKSFPIPKAYWARADSLRAERGVRTNFGFEGLAITPNYSRLYAGTENALLQDGSAADSASSSPSRILVYDVPSGTILHEFMYRVEPVEFSSDERGSMAVNGLTALFMLGNDGRMLSLDRNYVAGQGNEIHLYEVRTEGATDIKGNTSMQKMDEEPTPVQKKLVADLSKFDITLDNFEGLLLGPELPSGGRLLLIVSDNNFSADQQTLFTAFRLRMN